MVIQQAEGNERFVAEVGAPLAAGPWYNSSVAISHDGHIATVTLPVRGSRRASDVTVRVSASGCAQLPGAGGCTLTMLCGWVVRGAGCGDGCMAQQQHVRL